MKRPIVTIMLIGLLCYGTFNSAFAVLCRSVDGHVTVEPVVHSHCRCPDDSPAGIAITFDSPSEHHHCIDSPVDSNAIVTPQKDVRLSAKPLLLKPVLMSDLMPLPVTFDGTFSRNGLSSFHEPLKTIVLLA